MKIKYFIFIFLLLTLVFAQKGKDPKDTGKDPANDDNDKPDDGNNTKPPKDDDNNNNNPNPSPKPDPTPSNNQPTNPSNGGTKSPAGDTNNQPPKQTTAPKTVVQTTLAPAPKTVQPTTKAPVPTQPAQQPPTNLDNGTPVPKIELKGDTETHISKNDTDWTKYLLIGGGVIGGLFVIGVVFNFINKKKESNKDINDINFVVDNPAPEPEMSTSMFTPQNNMYGGQPEQQYNDYDMQYGQYGANPNTQYNAPADQYGQAYGAQDVNFAQRTLSLNRNPSANAQNYQVDQNAREVIYNHRPEAGDEIELRRGDQATIYEKYEDGWAWGYNITTGKTGMFPQQCLA